MLIILTINTRITLLIEEQENDRQGKDIKLMLTVESQAKIWMKWVSCVDKYM